MKKIFIGLLFFVLCSSFAYSKELIRRDIKISNRTFAIFIPKNLKGKYSIIKDELGIYVYDDFSKKAGFGGYAFGIELYEKPSEHAMMPGGRKIGELTNKKKKLYDVVLSQPTDVQYDYVNNIKEPYEQLYDLGEKVKIKGVKGSKYYKNQGMKGGDLYKDVLKKHLTAIEEKWDSTRLEKENMSYMYNVVKDPIKNIGYTYYDTNGDGIEELLIGEIAEGNFKGVIYDIYTMIERRPTHVISGGTRDRYYACDGTFICREYSSGALESGTLVYVLVENSTELFPQVGFKYDAYKNKKKPWFISYNFEKDEWENVSKKKHDDRKAVFETYERFDFVPFNTLK